MTNGTFRFTNVFSSPSLFFRAVQAAAPVLLSNIYSPGGGFQASLSGTSGLTYVVEFSTNLLNWTPLLTNANASALWSFTNTATNSPCRFYRVMMP